MARTGNRDGSGSGSKAPKGPNPNLWVGWPDDPELRARMGRKQSETKRRQRTFRESVKALMKCQVVDEEQRKALEEMGLDTTLLNQIQKAVFDRAAKGDVEAVRYLRDTAGEKPREGLELGNLDGKPLASIDLSGLTDEQLRALAAQRAEEPEEG